MTRGEALIHGDLHTSNVFADKERLKVIDMEYTFAGPLCYDIGYFAASLLTQYCTACFRPFPSEGRAVPFSPISSPACWSSILLCGALYGVLGEDAKPIYQRSGGFCEHLARGFLPDVLGFAAVPCFPRLQHLCPRSSLSWTGRPEDRRMSSAWCSAGTFCLSGSGGIRWRMRFRPSERLRKFTWIAWNKRSKLRHMAGLPCVFSKSNYLDKVVLLKWTFCYNRRKNMAGAQVGTHLRYRISGRVKPFVCAGRWGGTEN